MAVIRSEVWRKSIHLSCTLFPLLYFFWLTKEQIIILSGLITCGFFIAEFVRFYSPRGEKIFKSIFTPLLREKEKGRTITGATWLFMAITITFLIYSKKIAVAAVLVVTIADSLAAIVGKRYGRRRFFDKSWLGSSVFYLCTVVLLLIIFPEKIYWAPLIAISVACVEAFDLPVNDNVIIPIFTGAVLTIVY